MVLPLMDHPKKILETLNLFPKKSLSQNFFVSQDFSQKVVRPFLDGFLGDEIWEIGPGLGALTECLDTNKPITLFERDRTLIPYLEKKFPKTKVIEGDFLEQDLETFSKDKSIGVISNLPYQISTAVLFRLLELKPTAMVFMFQKEVAERIIAVPRTKAYGALSVLMQLFFEIKSIGVFPPHCFFPNPKIDSQALLFRPRDLNLTKNQREAVQQAFRQRRKKLTNNLIPPLEKSALIGFLQKQNLSDSARAEELSPQIFYELILAFFPL